MSHAMPGQAVTLKPYSYKPLFGYSAYASGSHALPAVTVCYRAKKRGFGVCAPSGFKVGSYSFFYRLGKLYIVRFFFVPFALIEKGYSVSSGSNIAYIGSYY